MPKLKRSPDDTRGGTDFIESLDRGLRVFELFGVDPRPMTLSDLAKAADLPRATIRRILFTLERAGYVASDRLARLPRLLDQLTFIVLAPHLGAKRAVAAIQAIRRPLRVV